jgi:hypothetical protein
MVVSIYNEKEGEKEKERERKRKRGRECVYLLEEGEQRVRPSQCGAIPNTK